MESGLLNAKLDGREPDDGRVLKSKAKGLEDLEMADSASIGEQDDPDTNWYGPVPIGSNSKASSPFSS